MAYVKKIWKDYPDTTTPILTEDLNNIENGIEAVDTALENLENNVNNIEDGLETVTNNVNNGWYQTGISPTFTFVSWDNSVRTGVVNSNLDLTPYLSVGMKVKFTQNSAIKYAFITAITSTQLTLFLGTDYSLNNSAISNSYYSMLKAPFGFPLNPDKWSVIFTDVTQRNQTSPNSNQIYNMGSLNFDVPTGLFEFSSNMLGYAQRGSAGALSIYFGISTSNNSISDKALISGANIGSVNSIGEVGSQMSKSNIVMNLAVKTKFYVVGYTIHTGINPLVLQNQQSKFICKFKCAYL